MRRTSTILLVAVSLSGCASTPKLTLSYPLTRTTAHIVVVRTLKCDASNMPIIASTATVTMANGADQAASGTLDTSRLNSQLANTTLDFHFGTDRRLTSINAESIGQGDTVIQSAISLAEAALRVADAGQTAPADIPAAAAVTASCKAFATRFKTETRTLTYAGDLLFNGDTDQIKLKPMADDANDDEAFKDIIGTVWVTAAKVTQNAPIPVTPLGSTASDALLDARQPGASRVSVTVSRSPTVPESYSTPVWGNVVSVGQLGTGYKIPIPSAALFGHQTFLASFGDDGALSELKYGKESGANAVLTTAKAGVDAVNPTAAVHAAKINSEADLIKAQDRLVKCKADHSTC